MSRDHLLMALLACVVVLTIVLPVILIFLVQP